MSVKAVRDLGVLLLANVLTLDDIAKQGDICLGPSSAWRCCSRCPGSRTSSASRLLMTLFFLAVFLVVGTAWILVIH